ncbi:hypothetical protein BATDEDRAFT_92875 [Batrachochytrium dendrobatidis JAM81]|uniref:Uncharacterized protein n=1 Tax=Batrachochytrium dendrobatidis (strain JAM81 / FGSC 10211) TaxID=684364 RepID=F4PEQ2_BATDJ|nr:uncharacterized protein BATDEDRAFT_92875 [Batrachochytrium dendrobatidis JAM81]EGF76289.1 hypothetical protein BATDEDRAFT_92875 [Batrachochytrium dendrobatidis JAM81]KAJ8323632.1 hypothetical protein O5D80_007520 [Batrachochytrium dendrobatidis]KAK5666447.1 hypothetical protein QVD99_007203 [Batrachochytrium dendrobatidis]|eukprot:XP_006683108.1 hypothetical protein BATDEDRAFT_92875 [Batrachochytrium dendrobatidis JAM81]
MKFTIFTIAATCIAAVSAASSTPESGVSTNLGKRGLKSFLKRQKSVKHKQCDPKKCVQNYDESYCYSTEAQTDLVPCRAGDQGVCKERAFLACLLGACTCLVATAIISEGLDN